MSTTSSSSNSFTASANSSLEIFEIRSCWISSPRSERTSPSSSISNKENRRDLCFGGEDSRAWAISEEDILLSSLLISFNERLEDSSKIIFRFS